MRKISLLLCAFFAVQLCSAKASEKKLGVPTESTKAPVDAHYFRQWNQQRLTCLPYSRPMCPLWWRTLLELDSIPPSAKKSPAMSPLALPPEQNKITEDAALQRKRIIPRLNYLQNMKESQLGCLPPKSLHSLLITKQFVAPYPINPTACYNVLIKFLTETALGDGFRSVMTSLTRGSGSPEEIAIKTTVQKYRTMMREMPSILTTRIVSGSTAETALEKALLNWHKQCSIGKYCEEIYNNNLAGQTITPLILNNMFLETALDPMFKNDETFWKKISAGISCNRQLLSPEVIQGLLSHPAFKVKEQRERHKQINASTGIPEPGIITIINDYLREKGRGAYPSPENRITE